MNSIKKKLKITINYNQKSTTILCDFYESISSIKTKIKSIFPELNDFNILYNNKILSLENTLQSLKSNELIFFIQKINKIICQSCENKNNNFFFCRNCLRFSCLNCKSFFHKNHNLIEINNNLEECVKIYSIKIQADLTHELNKYKEIQNKFKNSMLIDISSWKEIFIRKLNEIEKIYLKFEKFAEIFEKKINEIEKNVNFINKNIDKNLNDLSWNLLNKKKNKFDVENLIDYFEILKENEKFIKNLQNEINVRNEEFNCSVKINDCFEKIDKILNDLENFGNEGFLIIEKNNLFYNENRKNKKFKTDKNFSRNNKNNFNKNSNDFNKNSNENKNSNDFNKFSNENKNFSTDIKNFTKILKENVKTPYNNYNKSIKIMNNKNYNFTEGNLNSNGKITLNKKHFFNNKNIPIIIKNKNAASMDNEDFLNYIKSFNNNKIKLPNIKKYNSNELINSLNFN